MSALPGTFGGGTSCGDALKMNDLYRDLPFEDVDGGVWKQGWEITYEDSTYQKEPLEVFVVCAKLQIRPTFPKVMHSHTDPGWVKTFDQYFSQQTKHIFDNTLEAVVSVSTEFVPF